MTPGESITALYISQSSSASVTRNVCDPVAVTLLEMKQNEARPAFIAPIGALRCAKTALDIYNNQTEDASSKSSSATSNILGALRNFLNI